VTNSAQKLVIRLEMDKLLATLPILLEGEKQILGNTFAGMIAHTAWKFIQAKRPHMVKGRKFAQTFVELVGNEMVVTFTETPLEIEK
jgi:hypothetical protein